LILKKKGKTMDAKGRKVLTGLNKLGGEQEVFDLSIAVKMTEDAVQAILKDLSGEGLVSCRRDDGGKEFWSAAAAKPAEGAGAKEPGAAGKKKGKATAAGPDDRFDEFVAEPKAAAPAPSPAPIPAAETVADSFEPANQSARPAKDSPVVEEADFEPVPSEEEKKAVNSDAEFEPKPEKEKTAKTAKKKTASADGGASEPKTAKERELSAGPDDHFDEFAERVPSKPNLPLPLMAGAAILILIVILFIFGGGGGKKKINAEVSKIKTELTARIDKLDSVTTAAAAEIEKLRADNKALSNEIGGLKAELKKSANRTPEAAPANKPADKPKPTARKK
jgi:cell division protein FtsB